MNVYCDRCGRTLHPDHLFCPSCGAQAPRGTRIGDSPPEQIDKPVYCPTCGHPCPEEALFCTSCGAGIFHRPAAGSTIHCPSCGAGNSSTARVCQRCGLSLEAWFQRKGAAARQLGVTAPFSLLETYNGVTYRFLDGTPLFFGRNPGNGVIVPCAFVSGRHLELDPAGNSLNDPGSTNGTYINRSPERITSVPLDIVSEFNLAGYFTFTIVRAEGLLAFRLSAILEEEECRGNGNGPAFDSLRKVWFIYMTDGASMLAGKTDGKAAAAAKQEEVYWKIEKIDGYHYFSDPDEDITSLLIQKGGAELPVNWKITE